MPDPNSSAPPYGGAFTAIVRGFVLLLASVAVAQGKEMQGHTAARPTRYLQTNALPSNLPEASQEPTPAIVTALVNTVVTFRAIFDNTGTALGFAPFYELYLPIGADNQSCYEFISADW